MMILVDRARLPSCGERERLRSRLNHDLIKNRLLLALMRLRAIVSGQVAAEDGGAELRFEIREAWNAVKEDAVLLGRDSEGLARYANVLALPFIRQLDEEERRVVTEVLAAAANVSEFEDQDLVDLQQALDDADELVNTVAAGSCALMGSAELTSIQRAIDAVSRVAGCLSAFRRQETTG